MRKLQPALQFSEGRSKPWSGAKLVNCFSEASEGDKADAYAVMVIPGLVPFADVSASSVRGVHRMDTTLYTVIGVTLYSIAEDGTETSLGTVAGSLPVMMADNGTQLAIQGGALNNQGYVLDSRTLYTGIASLPQVSNVVYIDGYFVWTIFESDQFIISALNDGLSYDPLDVATVEGDPDDIIGVTNLQRELNFFGANTVEIWYNSGDADFPFARQGNAFIERGCIDRNSIVKIDNSVQFVGNDLIVYRLNGYQPVRISTHAIEFHIAQASWFRAFTYTQLGHKFFVLNTDVGCWAYDMATGAWAERKSLGRDNYRIACSTEAYGRTIMGGGYVGKLYSPDIYTYTEDGEEIPVIIELPSLQTDRTKTTLYSFEMYFESGVGTLAVPDPQVTLQYSKDGGRLYSPEIARTMGAMGAYQTRAIWRLGVQYRQLQIRLRMSSNVNRFSVSYFADVR